MCLREMHYLPPRTYIYIMKFVRSATADVYIRLNLSYFVTGRFGGRMMVLRCCFWLFNDGNFLVIYSPNFRMFLTFDFWIILSITFFFRRQCVSLIAFEAYFLIEIFLIKKDVFFWLDHMIIFLTVIRWC